MDKERAHERVVATAYDLHRASLQRYLTRVTRNATVAEDLVQDAFLRLTVETAAGRVPDDIGAWLHRVGHNLAMSRGRRLSYADRRAARLTPPDQAPAPELVVLEHERDRDVQAAVACLDADHRNALLMAAMGYAGIEIARSIGRTEGATRTMLCRARAKVRAQLVSNQPIGS